ncbi:MAG: hypothetical protein R3F13_15485 [Prosthecobacter sp.]
MRPLFSLLFVLGTCLHAQEAEEDRKLEILLLLPEPKAMRSSLSTPPQGSKMTVLTPARESRTAGGGIEAYSEETFKKLGLSLETFQARARTVADKRLLQLRPELIKGEDGKIAYAVYRGESPLFATLLVAPSLPKIFEDLFGKEIWVALPDRHALYVFPARPEFVDEFTPDLADRYLADPFAASCEIFSIRAGAEPRVVAAFAGQE